MNLEESKDTVIITTKFVNFVHGRSKKKLIDGRLKDLHDFEQKGDHPVLPAGICTSYDVNK